MSDIKPRLKGEKLMYRGSMAELYRHLHAGHRYAEILIYGDTAPTNVDVSEITFTEPYKWEKKVEDKPPSVYHKLFKGSWIDVYIVLRIFNVQHHEIGHAIKKLLMPGQRHGKSELQDLKEAVLSIQRRIAFLEGKE